MGDSGCFGQLQVTVGDSGCFWRLGVVPASWVLLAGWLEMVLASVLRLWWVPLAVVGLLLTGAGDFDCLGRLQSVGASVVC